VYIATNKVTVLCILIYFSLVCKRLDTKILQIIVAVIHISNLLKPTGCGMHQQVEYFNNCTLCPHCIYVFFICLRTNSDLCYLHQNLVVFITEMKSVYSVVRTGALNETACASYFKG
jgi:hypothetical protein